MPTWFLQSSNITMFRTVDSIYKCKKKIQQAAIIILYVFVTFDWTDFVRVKIFMITGSRVHTCWIISGCDSKILKQGGCWSNAGRFFFLLFESVLNRCVTMKSNVPQHPVQTIISKRNTSYNIHLQSWMKYWPNQGIRTRFYHQKESCVQSI